MDCVKARQKTWRAVLLDRMKTPSTKFILHLYDNELYNCYSCGANALAAITGFSPACIERQRKGNKSNWPDNIMISFLRKRQFKVSPITKSFRSYLRNTD